MDDPNPVNGRVAFAWLAGGVAVWWLLTLVSQTASVVYGVTVCVILFLVLPLWEMHKEAQRRRR